MPQQAPTYLKGSLLLRLKEIRSRAAQKAHCRARLQNPVPRACDRSHSSKRWTGVRFVCFDRSVSFSKWLLWTPVPAIGCSRLHAERADMGNWLRSCMQESHQLVGTQQQPLQSLEGRLAVGPLGMGAAQRPLLHSFRFAIKHEFLKFYYITKHLRPLNTFVKQMATCVANIIAAPNLS